MATAVPPDTSLPRGEAQPAELTITLFRDFGAAEAFWRDLEARLPVMTPYQRFDWISAYAKAGFDSGEIAILAFSDKERPVALLPLLVRSRFGVRVAHIHGMPISNSDSLIFDPTYATSLNAQCLRAAFMMLRSAGLKTDIVSFHCLQGEKLSGINPLLLAFPHAPAPNHLYFSTTSPSQTPYIDQALPHKRRTNIRRSVRRLMENFGPLKLDYAKTPAQVEAMLSVFSVQRAQRFREMGVENVFGTPVFQAFLRDAALSSLDKSIPALRLHALYAGDEIVAMSLGAYTATHYSQYINSTTSGPAAKYTLMGVLLSLLLDELRDHGIHSFDMGLGDFDYKTDWSQPQVVYDSVVALSLLGRCSVPIMQAMRNTRRMIKQTPALWRIARVMLAFRARLRISRDAP